MKIGAIIFLLIAVIVGIYYPFFYPPTVLKRHTQATLDDFASVIAGKDRAKIGAALNALLTDDVHIRLSVNFFSLSNPDSKPAVQDFDKASFMSFIDNVIYPLVDYAYIPHVEDFSLSSDHKTASINLASDEWADGTSIYGGTSVGVRFTAATVCDNTKIVFENKTPRLQEADCTIQIHIAPKPDEMYKLHNPDAMRDLLR